jgi:nucleotide-binding universal stress UspA family protein
MNLNVSLSPVSIVFVLLMIAAELGLMFWLLSDMGAPVTARAELPADQPRRNCIIVPLSDAATVPEVVGVACGLASDRRAELLLVHVLEVPLALSMYAPLPAAEEKAKRLLEAGVRIVREHNLEVESRVVRHRAAAEAILELAREKGAEAIVTGMGAPPWWSPAPVERTSSQVPRQGPCQIVVATAPRPA